MRTSIHSLSHSLCLSFSIFISTNIYCFYHLFCIPDISLLGDTEDSVPEQTSVTCLLRSHDGPATTTSTSPIRQSPSVRGFFKLLFLAKRVYIIISINKCINYYQYDMHI